MVDAPDPFEPLDDEWHRRVRLRDGTRVLIRQIRPTDRQRLQDGMARLSPATRYLRFHADIRELSEQQLDYLTQIDHHDHEALVAIDLDNPEEPGVGVARYIREPYEPHVAEAAITIVDDYQGQGAGTILLGALAARARTNGVRLFRNYVLEGNHAMLEVFDHLGAERHWQEESRLWCVDLRVPEQEEDLPDSPAGRAFLNAARQDQGRSGRLVSLFPPIWELVSRRRERGAATGESGDQDADPDAPDGTTGGDALAEAFRDHGLDEGLERR